MKRMVSENLIALLEDLTSKGITADDIEKAVDNHLYEYEFYVLGTYEEQTVNIYGSCVYPIAIDDVLNVSSITDDNINVLNTLLKIMHLYDTQNDTQFGSPIYIYIDDNGINLSCYQLGDNRITDIEEFYVKKKPLN